MDMEGQLYSELQTPTFAMEQLLIWATLCSMYLDKQQGHICLIMFHVSPNSCWEGQINDGR